MSVNVEYSSKEIAGIVLHNTLLMLVRRKNFNKIDKIFEELKPTFIEKGQVDFHDDNNNFHIFLYKMV